METRFVRLQLRLLYEFYILSMSRVFLRRVSVPLCGGSGFMFSIRGTTFADVVHFYA